MEDFLRLRSQQGVRKAPEKHQEGVLRRFWRPRRRFGRPKVFGTDYALDVKMGSAERAGRIRLRLKGSTPGDIDYLTRL